MALAPRIHLHNLCSRALRETDPQKLEGLLNEIDGIVSESIEDLNHMLKEVEEFVKKMEQSSGIHLA